MTLRLSSLSLCTVLLLLILCSVINTTYGQCSLHQFKCENEKCIPLTWRCDDDNDCGDFSDEKNCEARTCSETEFKCNNKKCIPHRWQCDLEDDCGDGSDEDAVICDNKTCSPEQFSCKKPGLCIPLTWQCDGQEDCTDGSDEQGCHQITCTEEEFACQNTKCITKRWVCDQDDDCGDRSDEANCPNVTCSSSEFMCNSGRCIPNRWRCDGDVDCPDKSDESHCRVDELPSTSCKSREFMCANRQDCIHITWQCDGDKDCPDGSDELNCNNTCRPDQFQCKNLLCIPGHLECNGQKECRDGSDEEDCPTLHKACDPKTQFDCGGHHCIPIELVCNGKNDCGAWEDEPKDSCNQNECASPFNGGCTQKCIDTPAGYYCECHPGYKLVDNKTCEDVNECEIPGSCSQICLNTKGSYKCECLEGYVLEPSNHHRCRAKEGRASLLFANRHDIRRIDLETGEYTDVVSGLRNAIAIDYVYSKDLIFWSDSAEEKIKKASLSTGLQLEDVVKDEKMGLTDGLAVDWIYEHIYWTDTVSNVIYVADFEGKMQKMLIKTGLDEPRAIAVNPLEGWMFWTDWGEPAKIERAGMDGTHRETIISTDIEWPNGLTIDFETQRIFWVDAKLHILSSAKYNGEDHRVVLSSVTDLRHPFSLAVFEDVVYWTDLQTESIQNANKFTGKDMKQIHLGTTYSPMDLKVYHPYKQPKGENHCAIMNGRCSHFCFPAPNITPRSAKYSCGCPEGMVLQEDNYTCSAIVESTTIILPPAAPAVTAKPQSSSQEPTAAPSSEPSSTSSVPPSSASKIVLEATTLPPSNPYPHLGASELPDDDADMGRIAGIVIGILGGVSLLVALVGFAVYKQYLRKNVTSMNFDNPVYRKTTEDQFSLEKNQYQPARSYPPSMEPLTSPGTNEFV